MAPETTEADIQKALRLSRTIISVKPGSLHTTEMETRSIARALIACREPVKVQPSDRDKVAFIATKILGLNFIGEGRESITFGSAEKRKRADYPQWNPLENIAQAFEVVEAVRAQHFFQIDSIGEVGMDWHCRIGWEDVFEAQNEKLPRAICDAAIEAYGGMPDAD